MSQSVHPHKATFLVRMWVENDESPEPALRGQIEHVQSGEKRYVRDMAQVVEFIQEHVVAHTHPETQRGVR